MNFRFVYIVLLISLIASITTIAQQDSTKKSAEEMINIKELVDQQIREIQAAEAAKENASKLEPVVVENKETPLDQEKAEIILIDPAVEDSEVATATIIANTISFIENNIFSKISIAIVTFLTMIMIFVWYRKQSKVQKNEVSVLKQNIRKMREEKIGGLLDDKLSKVRSKLAFKTISLDGRSITAHAKRLSISKGEIHLAAKINLMMRQS